MTTAFATPETEFDSTVLQRIQRDGWTVLGIPEDAEGPGFAFTLGLWMNFQHPELIMVGENPAVMQDLLNTASQAVRDGSRVFAPGQPAEGLLPEHTCQFLTVLPAAYRDYLGYALWLYGQQAFPALQCVWPDQLGRFPWQADAPATFRERQPVLGRVD